MKRAMAGPLNLAAFCAGTVALLAILSAVVGFEYALVLWMTGLKAYHEFVGKNRA